MTAATAVAKEHHWFKEPTDPAPRPYVVWLLIAQLIFFIALLGPAIVGTGLKVLQLADIGAIPEDGTIAANSVLAGFGALFATVANVVFGRVSDRTTSSLGRRRIWIVLGTIVMTCGFIVMALSTNLPLAVVGWSVAQLGANVTLAPFIATIADHVPKFQRGQITALLGIMQNVGILGGTYVAQFFIGQMFLMFVLPSVFAIAAMLVFAFVLPDQVLPEKPPRSSFKEIVQTFWVSPVRYPDYALAWWSRFLVTLAAFMFTTLRVFYLQKHIGVGEGLSREEQDAQIAAVVATSVLIYTIALVATAWFAGKLSDRLGRRKVFVWSATVLFAIGTVMLTYADSVTSFYIIEGILGFAYGIYVGVDLALVVDVLPNPDDSGKDLGVFNIANALPQTFAPLIAGFLAYIGTYPNFTLVLWVAGIAGLIGAAVILPIKKVR